MDTPNSVTEGLYHLKYPRCYAIGTTMGICYEGMEECRSRFSCSREDFDLYFRMVLFYIHDNIPDYRAINWLDSLLSIDGFPLRTRHFIYQYYVPKGETTIMLPYVFKDPLVTDIKITRDTIYEDGKYMCTMLLADENSIIEVLLEPLHSIEEALALYTLIGCQPNSVDIVNDGSKVTKTISFPIEARGGLGNAVLMVCNKLIHFKTMVITGRLEIEQISFINTSEASGLTLKIKDRISGHCKWYNAELPVDRRDQFVFVNKLYGIWNNEKSCILDGMTVFFGNQIIKVSCEMEAK